jgi:hypothetical protein
MSTLENNNTINHTTDERASRLRRRRHERGEISDTDTDIDSENNEEIYAHYSEEKDQVINTITSTLNDFQAIQRREKNKMCDLQSEDDDDGDEDDNEGYNQGCYYNDPGYKDKKKRKRRAPNIYLTVNKSTLSPWNKGHLNLQQWLLDAGKCEKTVASIIKYLGEFLTFCQSYLSSISNQPSFKTSVDLMLFIIMEKRSIFEIYRQDMMKAQQKPSTIKKRISAVTFAISYLEVVNDTGKSIDFMGAQSTTAKIMKHLSCQVNDAQKDKQNLALLIGQNRYPRHGLSQLRAYVDAGLAYFNALVTARGKDIHLLPAQNCFCLCYILCICWVYRNNARYEL